ncbi:MAG: hypothetical protein E3J87_05800 [Candidatus Cloacimonadota bacterium]|nr:MAG: hypothetical protein E3J87_05800 [Candidatus Cloacimonadota bacterium]
MKQPLFSVFILSFFFILAPSSFILAKPGITIESHHIIVEMSDRELIMTDALLLNIDTMEGVDEPISFSIPAGYRNLEILNGLDEDSLVKEKERIIDRRTIKEGRFPISFRYRVALKGNTYHFPHDVIYDTEFFYLLLKNLELQVTSGQLIDEGLLDMGERKYHALSGTKLKSGEKIEITFNGLDKQGRRKKTIVVSVMVFIILIILTIFIIGKGKPEEKVTTTTENLIEKKRALISLIARLDEEFEKGEIDEKVYRELRMENKEKLKRVMLELEKD